jgi:hypothetical protein
MGAWQVYAALFDLIEADSGLEKVSIGVSTRNFKRCEIRLLYLADYYTGGNPSVNWAAKASCVSLR